MTFHTSVGAFEPTKGCNARFQEFAIGTSEEITKNTLYFDIYSEKGIKNMDKSILKALVSYIKLDKCFSLQFIQCILKIEA
ncbi:hypothetical protein NDQ71_18620 [Pseudoalteromonas sp. KG3]|uniref:Uncharacterized protein n=1 Tax=Pseudoalteromonas prydzensis TaxID=182141 RepID=A0ABR9FGG0_9GAMM|nr:MULTISPECIES: hypothetical protein [Pseudoalteromonas]MBE0456067.1 hypothetical protein [Pseudoalteromonas prydzensis]WKD25829.1 hypothetical protein NDQ71_18620 [Pseudoalteromonas sp. KG3]